VESILTGPNGDRMKLPLKVTDNSRDAMRCGA